MHHWGWRGMLAVGWTLCDRWCWQRFRLAGLGVFAELVDWKQVFASWGVSVSAWSWVLTCVEALFKLVVDHRLSLGVIGVSLNCFSYLMAYNWSFGWHSVFPSMQMDNVDPTRGVLANTASRNKNEPVLRGNSQTYKMMAPWAMSLQRCSQRVMFCLGGLFVWSCSWIQTRIKSMTHILCILLYVTRLPHFM